MSRLRRVRNMALQVRRQVDKVLMVADERLAERNADAPAATLPPGYDWCWRPTLWRKRMESSGVVAAANPTVVADGTTLFHDCSESEISLRQVRNSGENDPAPYGLQLDVFRFDGSFLSVVMDLPPEGLRDLRQRHVIRIDCTVEMERPVRLFARMNVKHGPNTDELTRELPLDNGQGMIEFDLAYTSMNEKRLEKVWVDLIFEAPGMNQILLRDLMLSRRPRADL